MFIKPEITLLKRFLPKPIFISDLSFFIYRTDFLGIMLTTCSIIFDFFLPYLLYV
jgi:hypothetical protein